MIVWIVSRVTVFGISLVGETLGRLESLSGFLNAVPRQMDPGLDVLRKKSGDHLFDLRQQFLPREGT